MARQDGTWVEYATLPKPTILRPFSSELNTLRSATVNGNRGIFVQHGETIDEAIKREAGPAARGPSAAAAAKNPDTDDADGVVK